VKVRVDNLSRSGTTNTETKQFKLRELHLGVRPDTIEVRKVDKNWFEDLGWLARAWTRTAPMARSPTARG
jgi:hypothetical protein